MYPFERFSELAKAVLNRAQAEAERAGHTYIGTEHLLLGLIGTKASVGARALASLGIEGAKAREQVAAVVGRNQRLTAAQITPTAGVKKVIELAFQVADKRDRDEVGTGELLTAMAIEGKGVAARVLEDLGADDKKIAIAVAAIEARGATDTVPAPPPPPS